MDWIVARRAEPVQVTQQSLTSGGPRTRLSDEERHELAARYAPILVLFPEKQNLGPPLGGQEGDVVVRGDYHPRPVDIILDYAYLYPGLLASLRYPRRFLRLSQHHPLIRVLPAGVRRRFPEPAPNARVELPRILRGDPSIAMASVLDLIGIGRDRSAAQRAWKSYFRILTKAGSDQHRSRVYARVLQGDEVVDWGLLDRLRWYERLLAATRGFKRRSRRSSPGLLEYVAASVRELDKSFEELVTGLKRFEGRPHDVAVQYWFLYYYNDWYNRHEADWEGITLIFQGDPDAPVSPANLSPAIAGYAIHTGGRRRPWVAVEREGDHPVVYCARGSHASYFRYRADGYAAGMPVVVKIPWFNITIALQIRRGGLGYRDRVPDPSAGLTGVAKLYLGADYDLQVLPNLNPWNFPLDKDDIETLTWLVYPGLWGDRPFFSVGGSGPHGPLWQRIKSDNPFEWVRRMCEPDDIYSP